MILEKLAGPLIGAVIGYCTNYIAVKMLFYPKRNQNLGTQTSVYPGSNTKRKTETGNSNWKYCGKYASHRGRSEKENLV